MQPRLNPMQRRFSRVVLAALVLLAACSSDVHAVTAFWTGVGGANWGGDGGTQNWSSTTATPGVPYTPVNGDSLRFFGSRPNPSTSNDLVGLSLSGISFQSASSNYTLGGNKLTMTGNITFGSSGAHTLNLPLEINANELRVEGGSGSNNLSLNGIISEVGGSRGLTVQNGNVVLSGLNTYNGISALTVSSAARVSINTLANSGLAQSLGRGTTVKFGHDNNTGTLIYTGSSNVSTDKLVQPGRDGANTGSGTFLNNGSGTVTWNGNFTGTSNGTVTRTWTLGGTNTGDNSWAGVIRNYGANDIMGLTKQDAGKWILSGANTYTGATSVQQGVLLIDGSTAAGSAVTVDSAAVFGGNGTVNGDLTLVSGALFAFDPGSTLDLAGNLSLDSSFGVGSLRNTWGGSIDWAAISPGTYTLMNTSFAFNAGNISNFGQANAANVGSGKSAYFQNGSLQLVVVPEPTALGLTAVGAALTGLAAWRRRRG